MEKVLNKILDIVCDMCDGVALNNDGKVFVWKEDI